MTNSFDFIAPTDSRCDQTEQAAERPGLADERPDLVDFRRTATRADLLDAVAAQCPGLSRQEARAIFEMTLDEMASALTRGEPVKLRSFGLFSVRAKRQRMGRNPRTGAEVPITPRRVLTFKPSPVLCAAVDRRTRKRTPRTH